MAKPPASAFALRFPGGASARAPPRWISQTFEAALGEQFEAADALPLGRVTFEQMRGYWPLQTDDTTDITNHLNRLEVRRLQHAA